MRKKYRSFAVIALIVCLMSSIVACSGRGGSGRGPNIEKTDTTKTQLIVSNFDGGFGTEWLYKAKDRFEQMYADTSFEEGKTGVQIMIDANKDQGFQIINTIKDSDTNVYFTQNVNYYDFVNKGYFADITDIVTEDLTAKYNESGTIEEKFDAYSRDYFSVNGKYYGIPHYYCNAGIVYDVDLFEEKGFYFAADTEIDANTTKYNTDLENGNDGFIFGKTDKKSNGPDGKPGTADDGLPATYDEFFMLCDYIVEKGCTPVIWTGKYRNDYMKDIIRNMAIDYEGVEQGQMYYSFSGTAKNLVESIDENGEVVFAAPTEIKAEDNGYKMYTSAGRYYAMQFYSKLTAKNKESKWLHNDCFNENRSHTDAQDDFLRSRPATDNAVAMLFEGSHWVNEAKSTFEYVASTYGEEYSMSNRNLGMMPFPKATKEKIGEESTILDAMNSLGFINANCSAVQLEVAKKFLQFVNTDESLREFTRTTGTFRNLNYELTESDEASLSGWGKLLLSTKSNTKVVYGFSKNRVWLNNSATLAYEGFQAKIGNTKYNLVVDEIRGGAISAKDYFNGIGNYYNEEWWKQLTF